MKEKSSQEQAAAARQVELIVGALKGASADGYWLNVAGKERPRIYPQNATLSAFNSLVVGIHSDNGGYSTSLYTTFNDAKRRGESILKDEHSVPMYWYKWDDYVNRHDDKDVITREQYLLLDADRKKLYKGVRQREVRGLFNLEQTRFKYTEQTTLDKLRKQYGGIADRGNILQEERTQRSTVANMRSQINDNLIPIRKASTGIAYYDSAKDAVYMPDQKHFADYRDYVQEMMRQVVSATGHRERTAREGMLMRGGIARADSSRYELLISELASGVKMMELGMPAKLSQESMQHIDFWTQQLQENPCMIDAVETDMNNALDIIRKAEQGERMLLRGESNRQQTQELREKENPQVSSAETLTFLDIMAHGGMQISEANFKSREEMDAFLERFDLTHYHTVTQQSLERAGEVEDAEIANLFYTEATNSATHIYNKAMEMVPQEWERKGSHVIAEQLMETPSLHAKSFVVVKDKETGLTDVILPGGARSGGNVVLPDGDKRNFWLTPNEVMSPQERKEAGARVLTHSLIGMKKETIEEALKASGAGYVRFFNNQGNLTYYPDDSYFANKEVYVAQLNKKEVAVTSQFDVSEAVKLATEARFERVQMMKDDAGRWALLLKPEKEPSFCIYPDKEDTNRFFSTVRQNDHQAADAVRNELAQKYFALAKANPELQKDLFGSVPDGIDPQQIERVNIFKSKEGQYFCLPKIQGVDKVQPKEISALQWQRLWAADDVAKYKTALAATLFADVLQQKKQEETVEEHHEEEVKETVSPQLMQVDELKSKHPDAIILMRNHDFYEAFRDDAAKVAEVCKVERQEREHPSTHEKYGFATFPARALDSHLPQLIRAGLRVAICDALEEPQKQKVQKTESEERHTGRRM